MTTTASDVAQVAILLLERGYTDQLLAVDADGERCAAWDHRAVAWSLVGAVCAVKCPDPLRLQLLGKFRVTHGMSLHEFQRRSCTQATAIEALRRCRTRS